MLEEFSMHRVGEKCMYTILVGTAEQRRAP
jgi:hypothetical protein